MNRNTSQFIALIFYVCCMSVAIPVRSRCRSVEEGGNGEGCPLPSRLGVWLPQRTPPAENEFWRILELEKHYNGRRLLNFDKIRETSRAGEKRLASQIVARGPYVGHS